MDRILVISYFAPPVLSAESILVGKLLPELAKRYQIDLVAVGDDPDFRKDETMGQWMDVENLTVHRYHNPKPVNKIVRRLYQKGSSMFQDMNDRWLRQVLLHYKPQGPFQLIYSRSMPGISHLVAYEFKQRLGIPWVAQFSDPWAHNPYNRYPLPVMHQVEERNEAKVIRAADRFVFPTDEIRRLVASSYPDEDVTDRSIVLPHCFDERLYGPSEGESPAAGSHDNRIVLSYIGDFYGLRSPEPILKALALLNEQHPQTAAKIHLQIVGNVESTFVPLLSKYGDMLKTTIERTGQVSYLESLQKMKQSDILLLIDAPSDENIFLPSKLIDYFGARKPILGITAEKGTTANLLREQSFPVIDPRDPERIAAELLAMAERLDLFQQKAETNDLRMFEVKTVADQLSKLFEQLGQE
ncbi:glycosyltransferase [Effusibacillus dendaii]|nr:glycosyltransferase [Effusibacillus dendaii]